MSTVRLVVNTLAVTLALLAVSLQQDADAAIDPHSASVVVAINPLNPAIFDPAPKGFPSLSHFAPYEDELASIAPLPAIAPLLTPLGNLPALKLLDVAPADRELEKAAPDAAAPKVKQQAALTPEVPLRTPLARKPAPTVALPVLPPRRPRDADREHIPSGLGQIAFATPTLAPMGHTLFCLKYPDDCRVQKALLRGGPIALTEEHRAELVRVNAKVNGAIHPTRMHEGIGAEKWLISPKFGDCNDYAVTKRHALLALGWPSRDLLLAEVVTTWGEHHLVLVVRTDRGDLVADSLDKRIRNWAETPYRWVRVQKPENPRLWATIETPQPDLVAMAGHDNQL